jgi:hypothetical protein
VVNALGLTSAWSAPGVKSVRNELTVQLEAVD